MISWDTVVNRDENEGRFPFLALGGMDHQQNEIVLVLRWWTCFVAGGIRRMESFREE
jgi:hypothetical protein